MAVADITPQELKSKLAAGDEPIEIVDVRESRMFQEKHIPEAINVPYTDGFAKALKKVLKGGEDIYIVVYSEHEEMGVASKACAELEAAGFTKVHHLVGGLMGWVEAGGTVEFGASS